MKMKITPFVLTTKRIEALHDGVFAIVMTLMVFEMKTPEGPTQAEIMNQLAALLPIFLSYVVSFMNLGVYWVGQEIIFHSITSSDRAFAWINILFLMLVTLIPFSSAMLGTHPDVQISYIIYGINLIVIGLASVWSWCYATHHHRLTSHSIEAHYVKAVRRRMLAAPVAAVVAIIVSFFALRLSLLIYILILPYYIYPSSFDHLWHRKAVPHVD